MTEVDGRRTFTAPAGGVMTTTVGAVTGDLELHTGPAPGGLTVKVSYAGSDDTYRVLGSPVLGTDEELVLARLTRDPGVDEHGNPRPVDLCGLAGD